MQDTDTVYSHEINYDFDKMPDVANMLTDDKAKAFTKDFMIYDYWQRADNPAIRVDAKYDVANVFVKNGELLMIQKGYKAGEHVSMAGIQTKHLDSECQGSGACLDTDRSTVLHGTFRATFKVTGDNGGSCASFFWYRGSTTGLLWELDANVQQDDRTEIDVEIVTKGDSLVNDTINYTTHPSAFEDGSPIPGAVGSVTLNIFSS